MKFGIFYEHQLPRPWDEAANSGSSPMPSTRSSWPTGWACSTSGRWSTTSSRSTPTPSAPEVFLAAASQRTRRMRIGHGVVQTAPRYNHPARIAERIAMLDLVSNGRVEFGTGESSSEAELGGFGVDRDTKREAWLEGLEVAIRCMTETPFGGVDGRFVTMPPRNVVPKPVQKPHPPLWVACSRRDTILLAAEKGIGALSFAFVEPEDARQWVDDYEAVLRERCVPVGLAVNPQVACVTPMMCAPNEEDALARGVEGANFFGYSLAHYYVFGDHVPASTDVWEEFLATTGLDRDTPRRRPSPPGTRPSGPRRRPGTRPGSGVPSAPRTSSASSSGATRTPGWTSSSSSCRPATTATSTSWSRSSCSEPRCFPSSSNGTRPAAPSQGGPMGATRDRGHGPAGDRPHPVMPPDYVMRAIPKQMVEAMASEPAQRWLEDLADKQAAGVHDEEFQRLIDG